MTISLVPSGGEYGDRKRAEDTMSAAGIQQTTRQLEPAQAAQPKSRPLQQAQAFDGFDALASRQPDPSSFQLRDTEESRIVGLLESSPSPLLRDLARRVRDHA